MSTAWDRLLPKLQEMWDIQSAIALFGWDQHVLMPPGGAAGRGRAMATMQGIHHSRLTDPEIGSLLDELEGDEGLGADQRATLVVLRREYDKATKLPEALVREITELQALAFDAWARARAASDFSILEPSLARMFELKREQADAVGWEGERYDALLDNYEPGTSTAEVEALFADLVRELKPLAESILSRAGEPPAFETKAYPITEQEKLSQWLVGVLHFDQERGRLDTSPHPFTHRVGLGDVRQTTRYDEHGFLGGLRATMHETGHALYEQGLPEGFSDLPAGQTQSLALHESQSRLWEIQIGLSRPFSEFLLPHLQERFQEQLGSVSPDEYYRGINHPHRSMIRVQADEVTYNLHIAMRLEIELALIRDELAVGDLPDAWDAAMEKHLNLRPENQAEGVLQDMHWSIGHVGYFSTYTLGTVHAAAFFAKANQELGGVEEDLRNGETRHILDWMRAKIHSQASLRPAKEITKSILGEPISVGPFIEHIRTKYGDLYGAL